MTYKTYWVLAAGADREALESMHQRVFPDNELATVGMYLKVAVLDTDTPPIGAVLIKPMPMPGGNVPVVG